MPQYELNDGLALASPKRGEPSRNPLGVPKGAYARQRLLKDALLGELRLPCEIEGFTHLTKFEFGVKKLVDLWQEGDRWACTWLANRIWGRVPTTIELQLDANLEVRQHVEIEELSDHELLERLERVRVAIIDQQSLPPIAPDADQPNADTDDER